MKNNSRTTALPVAVGLIVIALSLLAPVVASAQEPGVVLYACYVPTSGVVYRIKAPGLPQECRLTVGPKAHIEFSWIEVRNVVCTAGEFLRGYDEVGAAVCAQPSPPPVPITVFLSANTTHGVHPLPVDFHCQAAGGTGTLAVEWDFGDGATEIGGLHVVHTYTVPGQYVATCLATDEEGAQSSDALTVVVDEDQYPDAFVEATPDAGTAPLTVMFQCTTALGNFPITYKWEFGEGSTSTLQNPSFTYVDAGTFVATCVVTDADGDYQTASVPISVSLP